MRNHLVGLIEASARSQPDILFLTGDLGFSVVEPLQEYLGPRFINAGVAEANMVSMAASLSFCGFEPYVYSIAPFMTARCYEQIRNDICYHGARVRLIGIGAGYSYGTLGPTHHSLEDATIMATLPNMTVFSPATTSELDRLFALSGAIEGAIYYRIARENGPNRQSPAFDLENPVVVWSEGSAVNLVTSGSLAGEVFAAADILSKERIDVRLISLPIIAPFPGEALRSVLAAAPTVVAFEGYDGNPLEAGVARLLSERGWAYPARFLNARRGFAKLVGGTSFQRAAVGLDVQTILTTEHRAFRLLVQDVSSALPSGLSVDHVVHAASPATPKAYGLDPVGTMMPNLFGTQILEHCRTLGGRLLYLSTSEVYGSSGSSAALAEHDFSGLDPMVVRACYAESKRAAETMCTAYGYQYGVEAVVVRPFHTYGPGLRPDDGRVFADVLSDAAAGRDIMLHGDGRARRAYCYLSDAIRGFLDLMTRGKPGEAYNLGNPRETVSTLELARVAASLRPELNLAVRFASRPDSGTYIASTAVDIVPDVSRLESLGWRAVVGLKEGLMRTLRYQRDATSSLSP